ncbi:hypothetical protein NA57DRAFT_69882 [Rhizodiscina lignyota]|uniref:AGC-kinase C-terminal domain-containing protein n=1 Tax=Rhizodiscina lignyota TaxID=1504668 RepID=A0A9P4IQ54_9PEZI|nr:hypothetical protein NA57DRAFT_69882 [Rhizodiscina lignyota]
MFSYLRSHHKRTGSTPTSPDIPAPLPPPKSPNDLQRVPSPDLFAYSHFQHQGDQSSLNVQSPVSEHYTPVSPIPPILPPIPRVASAVDRQKLASKRNSLERAVNDASGQVYDVGHHRGKRRSDESWHSEQSQQWQEDYRTGTLQDQTNQIQSFQRMERPQMNRRPHTSQSSMTTGLRSRGQSAQVGQGLSPGAGMQRGPSATTSPVQTQASLFSSVENISYQRTLPLPQQPSAPASASSFYSVAYDEARSHTPPIKTNTPGKPPTPPPPANLKQKTKLNLRNPMSLLLRRRSGQQLDPLQVPDEGLLLALNRSNLPDDYDPRIIGTRVHDFSAPRPPPKRFHTTPNQPGINESGEFMLRVHSSDDSQRQESESPPKPKRAHTPTFMEHFDDDDNTDKAVRAEELANKDFLARNSYHPPGDDMGAPLPPFARAASGQLLSPEPGPAITEEDDGAHAEVVPEPPSRTPPIPPGLAADVANEASVSSITATPEDKTKHVQPPPSEARAPSSASPPRPRQRTSRMSRDSLPSHLNSTASRFSFQFGGPDSQLQEKILEERHKAKQAQRDMATKMRQDEEEWVEDDDGYGDYDDGGMYEERIPGVNADFEEDGFDDGFSLPEGMRPMGMDPLEPVGFREDNPLGVADIVAAQRMALSSNPPSPADYSPASLDAISLRLPSNASARPSIDLKGRSSIGSRSGARLDGSLSGSRSADRSRDVLPEAEEEESDGVSLQSLKQEESETPEIDIADNGIGGVAEDLSDDLYFDDGIIEDPGYAEDAPHFDESAFDDPSNPLYERRPVNGASNRPLAGEGTSADSTPEKPRVTSLESNARPFSGVSDGNVRPFSEVSDNFGDPARKNHLSDFENLNAYHDALAQAATKAFSDGRFSRKESVDHSRGFSLDNEFQRYSADSSTASDAEKSKISGLHSSGQSLVQDDARYSNSSASQAARTSTTIGSSDGVKSSVPSYDPLRFSEPADSAFNFDPSSYQFDTSFDDYDNDDPMIAAANAEALANDDEGEYGREFGFYAAPPPGGPLNGFCHNIRGADTASLSSDDGSEVEFMNGGYFGPKGVDLVGRNKSLREPNLTPITERSEYSTRNSCVSLFGLQSSGNLAQPPLSAGITPLSAGAMPSPGLAELARMGSFGLEDDEMSMEKLMKLRRGAFGDGSRNSMSDSSAASGSSPRNSSPVAQTSGYMLPRGAQIQHPGQHPAVGWLNGVGIGVSGVEGLERLGEDDESDTDNSVDVEGEQDSDYESDGATDDRVYDDEDSPMPDSPTIIATDSQSLGSSPVTTAPPQQPQFPSLAQLHLQGFFNLNQPPSPPNTNRFDTDPHTPISPSSTSVSLNSPTTALRTAAHRDNTSKAAANMTKTLPRMQIPSSPSRYAPASTGGDGAALRKIPSPSLPHSPAHSRNSSQNESGITVTYVRERDNSAEGHRWVLERRRTSEAGEVTVLGREVVTGGRI